MMSFSFQMTIFFAALVVCLLQCTCRADHAATEPSHDCFRPCSWPPEPMVCNFNFRVEWFSSMSVFCGDCPVNITDCEADNCIPLNGLQRPIITVNRRLPGPSIQVCEGDVINVTVENRLDDHQELTIHWHGIHQVGSPFMDGAPKITQCPIPFGSSFVYTFNASNPGTHYWHAHSGSQRADGCAGSLVVRQAPERDRHYDNYDKDSRAHVLLLQDWFDSLTLVRFIGHHLASQPNTPDALLINGHGQRGHKGDPPIYTPRETLRVQPRMTHRFRVISNAIINCALQVSVDNHTLKVIATDGSDVMPTVVDAVVLFSGERYDFLLNADQDPGNYWLRVQGLGDCSSTQHELALINYVGTHEHMATSLPANATILDEGVVLNPYNELDLTSPFRVPVYSLRSLVKDEDDVLNETDVTRYYLHLDFNSVTRYSADSHMTMGDMPHTGHTDGGHSDDGHSHSKRSHGSDDSHSMHGGHMGGHGHDHSQITAQINHASFLTPAASLLTQYKDIDPSTFCDVNDIDLKCETSFCECTQVLNAALGEVIELVLVDEGFGSDQSHPMHIHGHAFRVLAQARLGENLTVANVTEMDQTERIGRNLRDPPLKDTVAVPDGGYTIVRFKATNPGWWLFHCHIQFHITNGMSMVIRVGDQKDLPPTPHNFPMCNDWPSAHMTHSHGGNESTCNAGISHVSSAAMKLLLVSWVILLVSATLQ